MNGTVTFDGAPPPGTINLGIGQPSADLLPLDLIAKASASFFAGAVPFELNYGVVQGDERFLESLAGFLSNGYGSPVVADELFVSGGNSQALDFVATVFAKPGDTVFVEEPSYFLAFQIFRDHGLNIVGIPVDDDGLIIEHVKSALDDIKPAFIYSIPSYNNPCGHCLTQQRRNELVELSKQHKFLIVADEVYQLLHYYEPPPPAFATMIDSGTVLSLGSFSKILAPGMRLGWIQAAQPLQKRMLANGFVNSGGSINHISSHMVRHAIELGLQEAHLQRLRVAYRGRVEAMDEALCLHFDGLATWRTPQGGYFFWLKFPVDLDGDALREQASDLETGFQAGDVFSSRGGLKNCIRLSFAHYAEDDIIEGIRRMRPLFDRS